MSAEPVRDRRREPAHPATRAADGHDPRQQQEEAGAEVEPVLDHRLPRGGRGEVVRAGQRGEGDDEAGAEEHQAGHLVAPEGGHQDDQPWRRGLVRAHLDDGEQHAGGEPVEVGRQPVAGAQRQQPDERVHHVVRRGHHDQQRDHRQLPAPALLGSGTAPSRGQQAEQRERDVERDLRAQAPGLREPLDRAARKVDLQRGQVPPPLRRARRAGSRAAAPASPRRRPSRAAGCGPLDARRSARAPVAVGPRARPAPRAGRAGSPT